MPRFADQEPPEDSHPQTAPLSLILYGSALACSTLAWIIGEMPGIYIAGAVGLLIALLGPCFHHKIVEVQGEIWAIRFGPVSLFRRTVKYADVEKIGAQRT